MSVLIRSDQDADPHSGMTLGCTPLKPRGRSSPPTPRSWASGLRTARGCFLRLSPSLRHFGGEPELTGAGVNPAMEAASGAAPHGPFTPRSRLLTARRQGKSTRMLLPTAEPLPGLQCRPPTALFSPGAFAPKPRDTPPGRRGGPVTPKLCPCLCLDPSRLLDGGTGQWSSWCGWQVSPQSPGRPDQPLGTGPERHPDARVRKSCMPTAGFLSVAANPASAPEQSGLGPARPVRSSELQREATWAGGSRGPSGVPSGPPHAPAPERLLLSQGLSYFQIPPCFPNAEVTTPCSCGATALFLCQGPG